MPGLPPARSVALASWAGQSPVNDRDYTEQLFRAFDPLNLAQG